MIQCLQKTEKVLKIDSNLFFNLLHKLYAINPGRVRNLLIFINQTKLILFNYRHIFYCNYPNSVWLSQRQKVNKMIKDLTIRLPKSRLKIFKNHLQRNCD
ncbi:unnamed protein product [Paramecium pentaurelia]|uniref:Uncharacterized protein n=1 Tax=Paramecium pentaurelia TaxID=43138 RepID=A0A8S1TJ96_9CILI|nr:unnamed protein product [Paramecium pentaurelia]